MKITVDQKELLVALRIVAKTLGKEKQSHILTKVHLEVDAFAERLSLTTTDLTTFTRIRVPAVIEQGGAALVSCKQLVDAVKHQEKGLLDLEATEFTLQAGNLVLESYDPLDFPEMPTLPMHSDGRTTTTFDPEVLAEALGSVAFCASKDAARIQLNGVHFDNGAVVASDGKRIAAYKHSNFRRFPGAVPSKSVEVIRKLLALGGDDTARAFFSQHDLNAVFFTPKGSVYTRLIEGQLPDYLGLLPKDSEVSSTVYAPDLAKAVKQVSAPLAKKERVVILHVGNDVADVISTVGSAVVPCEGDKGGAVRATYTADFLLDGLKAAGKQDVALDLVSGRKPLIMWSFDSDWLYGIMPVMSNK